MGADCGTLTIAGDITTNLFFLNILEHEAPIECADSRIEAVGQLRTASQRGKLSKLTVP